MNDSELEKFLDSVPYGTMNRDFALQELTRVVDCGQSQGAIGPLLLGFGLRLLR